MLASLLIAGLMSAWTAPARPVGHVNDFANVLSVSSRERLEAMLTAHEQQTTNQIVLVTIPSLDGRDISDVTYDIGQRWGVGQARRDNGVVFAVAPTERRMRIEVGKGLEGDLTDLESHIIIDEIVRPAFATGAIDQGIRAGAEAIVQAVGGNLASKAQNVEDPDAVPAKLPWWATAAFVCGLVILFMFFPRAGMMLLMMSGFGNRRSGGRGGFSGGGGRFGGGGASGGW